jgi:hypothetical protein
MPLNDNVHFLFELNVTFAINASAHFSSSSEFTAQLCAVLPAPEHPHYQAAAHVIGDLSCGNEIFDSSQPWLTAFKMPFREYKMRQEFGFKGAFVLKVSSHADAGSAYAPLLGATSAGYDVACSITLTPNICDDASLNFDRLSSPLFPFIYKSDVWDFNSPASSASAQCAAPMSLSAGSCPCFIVVVWTFWSSPPPYEMDWLSEIIDASGCALTHVLDLQMRCKGSLFSGSHIASNFASGSTWPSKVFVVSYFTKDFARGFGSIEACLLMWNMDGYSTVWVHFGDDGNRYDYLRYPRLEFVLRNHPKHDSAAFDNYENVLHLGIGYKIGFWPSYLRNISSRSAVRTRDPADRPQAIASACTFV